MNSSACQDKEVPDFVETKFSGKGIWFFQVKYNSTRCVDDTAQYQGEDAFPGKDLIDWIGNEYGYPSHSNEEGRGEPLGHFWKKGLECDAKASKKPHETQDTPACVISQEDQAKGGEGAGNHDKDGEIIKLVEKVVQFFRTIDAMIEGAGGKHAEEPPPIDEKTKDMPGFIGQLSLDDDQRHPNERENSPKG